MKYKSICFFISFLFISTIIASDKDTSRLFLSNAELESTIVFLEDSQKINILTSQLRQILDARKTAIIDNTRKNEAFSLDFLRLLKTFQKRMFDRGSQIQKEVFSIPQKISEISSEYLKKENLELLLSLLMVILIAAISAVATGVIFWRTGQYLQKSAAKKEFKYHKLTGISSYLLKKNALSFSLIGMGMVLMLIPAGVELQVVIRKIISGLLFYVGATGIVRIIWNRKYPLFSISNEVSNSVTKNAVFFLRFSLYIYILYSLTVIMWPGMAVLLSVFYKVITLFLVPSILGKYSYPSSRWFALTSRRRKFLPGMVTSVVKNILLRMDKIAFLFLLIITIVWISGHEAVHNQITFGMLKTSGIAVGAILLMIIWNSTLSRFSRSVRSNRESDSSNYFIRNIVLIRRVGIFSIIGISAVGMLQSWGIGVNGLINSGNTYLKISLRIVSILLGAFLLVQLSRMLIERLKKEAVLRMKNTITGSSIEIEKRVTTLGNIILKMAVGGIVIFALIMVMDELGFDIKAMLAGVGIIGLAVGFGAQNLVRDIISGLFLIFENRIRVGDIAIINGTGGLVEQVNLRTTVLRSADGTVHVFPNGAVNSLSNMTHEYSYYVFDISICYNENIDRVITALKEVGDEIISDPEYKDAILEPLEVQGVDCFADSAMVVKARIKTEPIKQWFVGREMNRRIKCKFDKEGIQMALPHRTLYFGNPSKPLMVKIDGTFDSAQEKSDKTQDMSLR